MKPIRLLVLATAAILFTLQSCSDKLVPFTQQIRDTNKLTAEELKSIQFYVSSSFTLRRGENINTKETTGGELTVFKDNKVEEVIIKAGTPCLIKDVVDGNRVTVSFEDKGSRYLVFGSIGNKDGYYTLMALKWEKERGKVTYGENFYYASPGSKDVFLAIKMKTMEKFKLEQKVVKGKKLN
jgi:hypothetical protein